MNTLLRIRLTRKANRALILQERQERIELGKKLAGLTDPTFLDRANQPDNRTMVLTMKGRKLANKSAYNNKRGLIQ